MVLARLCLVAACLSIAVVLPVGLARSGDRSDAPGGATPPIQAAQDHRSSIGKKVGDFALKDFYGHTHTLADYADSKLVVVAFLGTECPLAKLYARRLVNLHAAFRHRGVTFLAINANRQDSITELASFAQRHEIAFPILKDVGNRVADTMGAVRTPEVYVLDEQRVVRYRGRIDDQYGIGFVRPEPTRDDLRLALEQLLAGETVETPQTEAVGCLIGRIKSPKPDSSVTYSNQVARILQNRCVECHREGQIAPFALTNYEEVVGWADMMMEVVDQRRMPPWHASPNHGTFANDNRLSNDEIETLRTWVDGGAPQGDPRKLPQPKEYGSGWQLPREPDLVYNMSEKPFPIRADGVVDYQYFYVDPGFTEDKWVLLADVLPGNPLVVHHAVLYVHEPESSPGAGDAFSSLLVCYIPGGRLNVYPKGHARRIRAGSKFVFEMHYTPVGSPQTDHTKMGLIFADPSQVTHKVVTMCVGNDRFRIPPRDDNHRVDAITLPTQEESLLLSMQPHMHLRGKSFLYEAIYPDGQTEILLDVPRYDPNWQTSYRLAEPKLIPAGTRIRCTAIYDNSEYNVFNPDPNVAVRLGNQVWDEMMNGYFDVATPVAADRPIESTFSPADALFAAAVMRRALEIIRQFDENGDGKVSREEVPLRFRAQYEGVDTDGDGAMSLDELRHWLMKRDAAN